MQSRHVYRPGRANPPHLPLTLPPLRRLRRDCLLFSVGFFTCLFMWTLNIPESLHSRRPYEAHQSTRDGTQRSTHHSTQGAGALPGGEPSQHGQPYIDTSLSYRPPSLATTTTTTTTTGSPVGQTHAASLGTRDPPHPPEKTRKTDDDLSLRHLLPYNLFVAHLVDWLALPRNLASPPFDEGAFRLSRVLPRVTSRVLRRALDVHVATLRSRHVADPTKRGGKHLTNISPLVHQVWLTRDNAPSPSTTTTTSDSDSDAGAARVDTESLLPESAALSMESFKRCSGGDVEHLLWGTQDVRELVEILYPAFAPAYFNTTTTIIKADFARVLIVYAFGGVYADLDVTCIKNPHDWTQLTNFDRYDPPGEHQHWRNASLIVGVEGDCSAWGPDQAGYDDCVRYYARIQPLQFASWTFAGAAGYMGLLEVMQGFSFHLLVGGDKACVVGSTQFEVNVMDLAGPGAWTDLLRLVLRRRGMQALDEIASLTMPVAVGGEVVVLPAVGFSPAHWKKIYIHEDEKSPKACVQHHYASSWRFPPRAAVTTSNSSSSTTR